MWWIFLSLLAAFLWAVAGVIDKFMLGKWLRNSRIPLIIVGFVSLVLVIIIDLLGLLQPVAPWVLFAAIFSGAVFAFTLLLYFKAMQLGEASRIIPLLYISTLFTAILAAVFLGEIFTVQTYIGIFLLVGGAIFISLNKFSKFTFDKAFWYAILSAIISGANVVLTKYLLNFMDYWSMFGYARTGTFLFMVPFLLVDWKELVATVKKHGMKVVYGITTSEVITNIGGFVYTIAMAGGFATLVSALTSVQPFFTLLLAVMLSIFFPHILKEEIGKKTLIIKFIAIILIFIGAILVI